MINKRRILIFLVTMLFLILQTTTGFAQQQPEYAKWGKIAVEQTTKQFPKYEMVDYKYEGKVVISDERQQYNFKMTLELNGERKEVRTYVLVNPKQDQLIDVYFDED
ncbi:DUF3889 domain-containing protein [Anaerobacillus alkaliphilus]|uniref:DUF3889 domain-containing protein n=1 Tax=Anaerobacillus alkaliphilus TaxID=1548597 RepID=A0A4Q0VM39_9BACI|nr:DUF3889 domain-containing protein [Anaerobacillus alkaliphilus]RXI96477.1 DUF3889 domain-containing protein [Anaerobacillus alkaliphilus]